MSVPRGLVFGLVIVLPLAGFLIGSLGSLGGAESTTAVNTAIPPEDIGLEPGMSASVSVLVENPTDEGVRVVSIAPSESQAAEGCPAGALTSEELSNPAGYIPPNEVNAYPVTVTLKNNAGDRCVNQALPLTLTVTLASAR